MRSVQLAENMLRGTIAVERNWLKKQGKLDVGFTNK